jgi:hypothetical protein
MIEVEESSNESQINEVSRSVSSSQKTISSENSEKKKSVFASSYSFTNEVAKAQGFQGRSRFAPSA